MPSAGGLSMRVSSINISRDRNIYYIRRTCLECAAETVSWVFSAHMLLPTLWNYNDLEYLESLGKYAQ